MTDDRWRRVEALYHAALAQPADERTRFLDQACGADTALRQDVDSLLAQSTDAEPALATGGAVAAVMPVGTPSSLIGQRIGVYQIQSLLGSGGMDI